MHDIWNPWHGCVKCSEGCQHCYMYFLDSQRDKNGADIYKTKTSFTYPLQKKRDGRYKIQSGEMIRVCMTSDFFLEEADAWRNEVWKIIRERCDVKFFILTKRPERVAQCLPNDWNDGYENVLFNVTCENQKRADERIPILLRLPFKHKGIMCTPLLSQIDIRMYLEQNQIEQVICGGENYDGCRPCHCEWVKFLYEQCKEMNITFNFLETGSVFVKDGITYTLPNKKVQSQQAYKSHLQHRGKPIDFKLYDTNGNLLSYQQLYKPYYHPVYCKECANKLTCNGCVNCGACQRKHQR